MDESKPYLITSQSSSARCTAAMLLSEEGTPEAVDQLTSAARVESDLWSLSFILFCIDDVGCSGNAEIFSDLVAAMDDPQRLSALLLVVHERSIPIHPQLLESLLGHPQWYIRLQACQCLIQQKATVDLACALSDLRKELQTQSLEASNRPPSVSQGSEDFLDAAALNLLLDRLSNV